MMDARVTLQLTPSDFDLLRVALASFAEAERAKIEDAELHFKVRRDGRENAARAELMLSKLR